MIETENNNHLIYVCDAIQSFSTHPLHFRLIQGDSGWKMIDDAISISSPSMKIIREARFDDRN